MNKGSVALVLLSVTSALNAYAGPGTSFTCTNHMYRDARIELSGNHLLIQDQHVSGTESLEDVIKGKLGTSKVWRRSVALRIPRQNANCSTSGPLLINCQGKNQSAVLEVGGFYFPREGESEIFDLRLDVELLDFNINTTLSSNDGPISLEGDKVQVTLDTLLLNASADLQVEGQRAHLEWSPFFFTSEINPLSSCKMN